MAKPELRNEAKSVFAGLVIIALIVVAMAVTTKAQSGHFFPVRTVRMAFNDVHTLQVNDDLRVYSNRIGRVSSIDYRDGEAIVTAELITAAPPIYKDASAQVLSVSPLALKYVNLDPGTEGAGRLGDGEIVPSSHNMDSADLQDLLDVLDAPTRAAATSTLRQVGVGLGGHTKDLNDFFGNATGVFKDLGTTSDALSSNQFDFHGLISSVNQLSNRLDDRQQQLRSLVDKAGVTIAAIGVDDGQPLKEIFQTAPSSFRDLRSALVSLKAPLGDVQTTMETIRPGADDFGHTVPDLRGTFREGVPVLDKVPDFSDKAEPAMKDLESTFSDARPLAPKVRDAFDGLAPILGGLAPYGPEIGQFFVRGHSFVSEGPAPNIRYARFDLALGAQEGTGGLFPSVRPRDPYPRPGEADHQAYHGFVPAGVVPSTHGVGR